MKCSLWLAVLILAVAGCVSPEHFNADKIDRNGSFYIDCNPAVLAGSYQKLCDSVVRTAAGDNTADAQLAESIIANTLFTKILLQYSGLNEIKRLRASSTLLEDGSYLNCAAATVEPDKKNGVSIFGENRELSGFIAKLPAECIAASAVSVDLAKLWNSIKSSNLELKNKLAAMIQNISGVSPEEFAVRHSGVFTLAIFPPATEPRLCLFVPDKDKLLYNRLKTFADKSSGELFEIPFANLNICIAHKDDCVIICGSPQDRQIVLKPIKTLAETKEFSDSPANSAPAGVELDWTLKGVPLVLYMGAGKGFSDPAKCSEYSLIIRTGYGFYLHSVSSQDWNVDLFRDVLLTFTGLMDTIKGFAIPVPEENNPQPADQPCDNGSEKCFNNLQKLGKALDEYAKKNGGYPAATHTDGLNLLTDTKALTPEIFVCPDSGCKAPHPGVDLVNDNTGYIYFGAWSKNKSGKLPLVIDMPDNHKSFFHVLFADGSVQKVELSMQMSVKRMASALHTVFKYQEDEFSELIRRAELLDKKLDKESK